MAREVWSLGEWKGLWAGTHDSVSPEVDRDTQKVSRCSIQKCRLTSRSVSTEALQPAHRGAEMGGLTGDGSSTRREHSWYTPKRDRALDQTSKVSLITRYLTLTR